MTRGKGGPSASPKRRGIRIAPYLNEEVRGRFWAKVIRRGPDECWTWTGGKVAAGHGMFAVADTTVAAPRVAWVIAHGDPPPGMVIYQRAGTCNDRACVNPAHHALGTYAERTAAAQQRGTHHEHKETGSGHRFVPGKGADEA